MTNDLIALIANIALALSFVIGLVFGIAQVRAAARDRRERLTLETLREFQAREFLDLMYFVMNQEIPSNRELMLKQPADIQINLMQFAQIMESLGILVAERLINIDLVDKSLGSFVVTSWDKYKVLFYDIREKTPDPYLGEYFQWLAEKIKKRMEMNPRKPFHETHK
jgi:hypothetical protein